MTPRVLVVEDEEALALLLRYNLEAEGYAVDAVARRRRGRDAAARERRPTSSLLDWMLPGLSGIEVCRRLRARDATRDAADHHADRARRGRPTACAASPPAPTTTWSSRSRCPS